TGFPRATAASRIKEVDDANSASAEAPLVIPTTAAALERQARLLKTAKEAHRLYRAFFDSANVSPDEKKAAEARLVYWEKAAAKDLIRLGTEWVSPADAQSRQSESRKVVSQAIQQVRTNAQSALKDLERASRIDPNSVNAVFLIGVIQGGVIGNLQ